MSKYKMTVEFSCNEDLEKAEEALNEDLEGALEYFVDLNRVTVHNMDIVKDN